MRRQYALAIIIASCAIALGDAIFKRWAILTLPVDAGPLSWPLDFALHKNPGIAFDIPIPLSLVVVASLLVSILLVRFALQTWKTRPLGAASAVMIVIGALGNMTDRIANHFTTDYIILFSRTAINLSDILILTGAILLIYYTKEKDAS